MQQAARDQADLDLARSEVRAPRTVTRGGSAALGRSSSTLSSTHSPRRAHSWKLGTLARENYCLHLLLFSLKSVNQALGSSITGFF